MVYNKLFRFFLKNCSGATAIEFGLLAMPFFMLLVGILELSMFYASGVVLEGAAISAARTVRTGQAQNSADPQSVFEEALCNQVSIIIKCNNITYEAVNFGNSFNGVSETAITLDEDGNMEPAGFTIGGPNSVIMIRLAYHHNFLFPFLGAILSDGTQQNASLHLSTVVLRTEPYGF